MKTKLVSCLIVFAFLLAVALSALAPTVSAAESEPVLDGKVGAALTVNLESGESAFELEADRRVTPGTTARLMLALAAYSRLADSFSREITLTDATAYLGDVLFLVGDRVTVGDLFAALLIDSSMGAATALAVTAFGSLEGAVEAMNAEAAALSMSGTRYSDIYGIDSRGSTTARDVARLAEKFRSVNALRELAVASYRTISVSTYSVLIYNRSAFASVYYNKNYLRSDIESYAVGVRSDGSSDVICATEKNGLSYLTVVLGAPSFASVTELNLYSIAISLCEYARDSFGFVEVLGAGRVFGEIPVELSRVSDHVTVCVSEGLTLFCKKDTDVDRQITFEAVIDRESLVAPVGEGERVGTLTVRFDGKTVAELELQTANALPKSTALEFFDTAGDIIKNPVVIILLCLAGAALLSIPFISAAKASLSDEEH